jgi:hypothetical protein
MRLNNLMGPTISEMEIEKRLNAAIDRLGLGTDRERVARSLVPLFLKEVKTIIMEQVRRERKRDEWV